MSPFRSVRAGGWVGGRGFGDERGERERSHVVRLVVAKKVSQRAASERLGICVRQVKRLVRAYRRQGDAGLVSKQRGRISPLRLGEGERLAN